MEARHQIGARDMESILQCGNKVDVTKGALRKGVMAIRATWDNDDWWEEEWNEDDGWEWNKEDFFVVEG